MGRGRQTGELERRLGTTQVLAIGIGTMVGAGIFVFPGLAVGEAGSAAMVSFGIGAVIALFVALPAAELATAMPHSGGGYYFVSRSMGRLAGSIVGVGQWFGLLFASAFYLVGFGHYAVDLLQEIGLGGGEASVIVLALAAAALLTGISVIGAEKTGDLQNAFVGGLLVILIVFLGYGLLGAFGVVTTRAAPEAFAPQGTAPIFTTAALVFTSYLGFVQVATVGGDVKNPGRNIPVGMIGGVLVVGALYVLMIFVCVNVFEADRLEQLGETAVVEVGRTLLGPPGALALLGCGLLATLSSANASIMSASRAAFALSRDELVPEHLGAINERFSTPHFALAAAGASTILLIMVGGTEFLAEVASFLHLLMYGLICVAMLKLRYSNPEWYNPSFRAPGYPVVPLLGGIASFALIGFMQLMSIVVGALLVVVALAWYAYYVRGITPLHEEKRIEERPAMLPESEVIYPVRLPDPEPPSPFFVGLFATQHVVVLGCYVASKQAAVEQVRDQFGRKAERELREVAVAFEGRARRVETRLVFTHDMMQTIDRVATEEQADAIVIPGPLEKIECLLVPIRGRANLKRIIDFVVRIAREKALDVTYMHIDPDEKTGEGQQLLQEVKQETVDRGVEAGRCHTLYEVSRRPVREILRAVEEGDYDVVVIGETEPTLREQVMGDAPSRIASGADRPVIVVENPV